MSLRRHLAAGLLASLITSATAQPKPGLVQPEVKGWQATVGAARNVCEVPGSELFPEALEELGGLGGALMDAPLHDLMVELEQRRNLQFKYFTPWHVKDRDTLRAWLKAQFAKEYPPEKVASDEAILKALGLAPKDFQLVSFMEDLLTSQIAGVYDPDKDQFFLVDTKAGRTLRERSTEMATNALLASAGLSMGDQISIVTIHELDHALGGQHFPLLHKFGEGLKELTTDQQMGVQALIEGDATFVMIDHQNKRPASEMGEGTAIVNAEMMARMIGMMVMFPIPLPGTGEFADAPLYFQKGLMFPYLNGAELVSTLRHASVDWSAVDATYGNPPISTRQVLHPEDYLYLMRKPVTPDFSRMPAKVGPWRKVADDSGGEFLLRVVLEQHGVAEYATAAEGWNGDRLRVYKNEKTDELAFVWAVNWDNEREAQEFKAAAVKMPFQLSVLRTSSWVSSGFDGGALSALKAAIL